MNFVSTYFCHCDLIKIYRTDMIIIGVENKYTNTNTQKAQTWHPSGIKQMSKKPIGVLVQWSSEPAQ